MRRRIAMAVVAAALLTASSASARAALLTKTYQFKPDIVLQVGESVEGGLRLDSIQIFLPSSTGVPGLRTGGVPRAEISISNLGSSRQMFGLAIVLLDDEGRLLGAANGGPRVFPLRPNRQGTFRLVLDGVNGEAYKATQFKIALETKP
ncbi:MAG: hypothetical protein LAO51_10020 [Acidobacteriia bacterium]|nr:hypothetical protein [Terriglobia bacterium]